MPARRSRAQRKRSWSEASPAILRTDHSTAQVRALAVLEHLAASAAGRTRVVAQVESIRIARHFAALRPGADASIAREPAGVDGHRSGRRPVALARQAATRARRLAALPLRDRLRVRLEA